MEDSREQIEEELRPLIEERHAREKITRLLKTMREELSQEEERLSQIDARQRKEFGDWKDLEGVSVESLYFTILGEKEERRKKEKKEYLAVRTEFESCGEICKDLRNEISQQQDKLSLFVGLDARYAEVLRRKDALLRMSEPEITLRIDCVTEKIINVNLEMQELVEATGAGKACLMNAQPLDQELGNAVREIENLREERRRASPNHLIVFWDQGKANFERAQKMAYQIQRSFRHFRQQLMDVARWNGIRIDLHRIPQLDVFVRNLFGTLMNVAYSEENALYCQRVLMQFHGFLSQVLRELASRRRGLLKERRRLMRERNTLIETA